MTVEPHKGTGNLPAGMDDLDTGLDEFGLEDAVIPRLQIKHKEGVFKDSLSNQSFEKISVIILGLVKQRILWHSTVDDNDKPMCRSNDHEIGFPNFWPGSDADVPKDKRFPWEKSNFEPKDFPPDEDGQVSLPCERCALKEWGSHPDGKKPYCSEQFTLAILFDPFENGGWVPAILTIQKTGIKPLRSYLTAFKRSQSPAYTKVTEITLSQQSRGSNEYCVPQYRTIGDTDQENWREYSVSFGQMRNFLKEPPGPRSTEDDSTTTAAPSDNVNSAPAAASATVQGTATAVVDDAPPEDPPQSGGTEPEDSDQTPVGSADQPATDDDDDLPF